MDINNYTIFKKSSIPKKTDKFWPINWQKLYLFKDQEYDIIKKVISSFYRKVKLLGAKYTFNN